MRDVVKTNVKRERDSKRTRRRKKHVSIYVFLILILVLGIGILLSVTLLFNVNIKKVYPNIHIDVQGDVEYSPENVIKASGISDGDNLVRLDAKEAERNILARMIYIEEADVQKKYPDSLEINLVSCIPSANVEYGDRFLLISRKGKILENLDKPKPEILTIKGLEPKNSKPGEHLESEDRHKDEIYINMLEAIAKNNENRVTMIDLTDRYSIKMNFDNRVDFELGNSLDIAYKINLANTVLNDIGKEKKGKMLMVKTNQISFRSSDDGKTSFSDTRVPIEGVKPPETTTGPAVTEPTTGAETDGGGYEYYEPESYEYDDGGEQEYDDGGYDEPEYEYDEEEGGDDGEEYAGEDGE